MNVNTCSDCGESANCEIVDDAPLCKTCNVPNGIPNHAWAAYVANVGEGYADANDFNNRYIGQYSTKTNYVNETLEDYINLLPDHLQGYFDTESWLRDCGTSFEEYNGWFHAFSQ